MNWKRLLITLLIIVAIVTVGAGAFYGWFLGQNIYISTYEAKAGVNFWTTWTLDNHVFYASIVLTILSMITLPQRSSFLSFISAISTSGPIIKRLEFHTAIVWRILQAGGFFLFYVTIGGHAITGENVAFLWMLQSQGSISISPDQVSTLFALPFYPGTSSEGIISLIPAMEAYQLYVGLFSTFLVMSAGRLVLSLVTDMMVRLRDIYVIISKGLFASSFVLVMQILSVPFWTVNAGTWLSYITLFVSLAASLIGAVLFLGMRIRSGDVRQRLRGKIVQLEEDLARLQGELISLRQEYEAGSIQMDEYRKRVEMLMEDRAHITSELRRLKLERLIPISGSARNFGFVAVLLIAMVVMLPVIQAFSYGIPMDGDRYLDWKYNYETQKEIDITNWAASLDGLNMQTLDDLTSHATPEGEVEFLTSVRQWDNTASYYRMRNQIGTNWMELADSDIVYLKGHEYWIAPLTFDENRTKTNFINQHLYYTHTEGLVVLDAFTGDLVEDENLVALLNRNRGISVYYGEDFDDVVFVNVLGFNEIGNHTYAGTPDYTLSGFESTFYIFTMGPEAWSYMGQELDMLVERDVVSRVQSIMLQGISVDSDPYIVVDPDGEVYYATSVFIDYRLASNYAHENYLRFLGVVLVGIENGDLHFYTPQEGSGVTPEFFIDSTYLNYYPWEDSPDWLQSQMKWPEDLYERQLDVAYIMHVEDGLVWKSGQDFHQTPIGSDTRYIIMRIEGEDRFVAMHNSEYREATGRNLAGLYVMGCGDKSFGQLSFYGAGELGFSTLLGPNAAVQAFETSDVVRTQLQLWGSHRFGNRLLYLLAGDLYFVVPVFLEVETSEHVVIEKLGGVGLVDAKTGERVELGTNVIEAYYKMFGLLNQTGVSEGDVGIESAIFNPVTIDSGDYGSLITLLRNNDNESHHLYLDISVAAGNFSVIWHGSEVNATINPTNVTYTLDIGTVGSGDLYGTSPSITAYLPVGLVLAQYLIVITLRTEDGVVDQLSLFLTVT